MTRTGTGQTSPNPTTATLAGGHAATQAPPTLDPGLEPKPAGAADAKSIFVSPRVIDRLAFDEYASILRKLVGDASTQRELLQTAADKALAAESGVGTLNKQLHTRVDQATRALPLLDQRLAKAEQLLSLPMELLAGEKAKAVEKARKELEEQLAALVEAQVAQFRSTFETALRQHVEGLAQEAIGGASEPVIARAGAAAEHLEQTVTEAESRVSSLVNLAESQSQRAAAARDKQVEELEKRLASRIAECDAELAQRAASIDAAAKVLDEKIKTAQDAVVAAEKIKPAKLDKTIERLATIRESIGDVTHFEKIVDKAEDLAQSAVFATAQLEAIKKQADQARSMLGNELLDGVAKIDAIESRLTQLLAAAQQAGTRVGDAETRLQTRMNELETRVQSATQRAEQAIAPGGDAQLQQIAEQTQKMGEWLSQIVHQAHDCGRALDDAIREADALAGRLDALTGKRAG